MDPLSRLIGYGEGVSFDKRVDVPPPPVAPPQDDDPRAVKDHDQLIRFPLSGVYELNENDVREALLNHVDRLLCYGKRAVKEMLITKMDHYSAYRYTLETLTENRSLGWAYDSYAGIDLDSPKFGPPPDPWEIDVQPPETFENRINTVQVALPHTQYLQICHFCNEVGRVQCNLCRGRGKIDCNYCKGFGTTGGSSCIHCNGGIIKCNQCKGLCMNRCDPCLGTGKIVSYIALFVSWAKHFDSCLIEHTDTPKDMVKKAGASGSLILNEINENIKPIEFHQESSINRNGIELMEKHIARYITKGRSIFHRQKVARIPIVRVYYSWRTFQGYFWVYGIENYVLAPNYPQKNCCGCTIN